MSTRRPRAGKVVFISRVNLAIIIICIRQPKHTRKKNTTTDKISTGKNTNSSLLGRFLGSLKEVNKGAKGEHLVHSHHPTKSYSSATHLARHAADAIKCSGWHLDNILWARRDVLRVIWRTNCCDMYIYGTALGMRSPLLQPRKVWI